MTIVIRAWACISVFLASLILPTIAFSTQDGYMQVVGKDQGLIQGNAVAAGQEDNFVIHELHHLTSTDSRSIEHQPLIVTTPMSRGVPTLLDTMQSGELLDIGIRLMRTDPMSGSLQEYYSIELRNARLILSEPISPDSRNSEFDHLPPRIRLRFEFESMTHTYKIDDESVDL